MTQKEMIAMYGDAPTFFAKCLQAECVAAESCLRAAVAKAWVAEGKEERMIVMNPAAVRPAEGEKCPHFVSTEPVKVAFGFIRALNSLPHGKVGVAASRIMALSSRRTYYRQRCGDIALNEAEQRKIAAILEEYGAATPVSFDRYDYQPNWNEE